MSELTRVNSEIEKIHSKVAAATRLGANAARAIEVAEGPLDVLRMADAVNAPVKDRTLTVEDTSLVIAGVRVPRKTEVSERS